MSLFHIDENKCVRCGICAEECPAKIIDEVNAYPVPAHDADELCIRCGHCVAVCPKDALFHEDMNPEDCALILKELAVGGDQAEQLLRSRRSIRNFKNQKVEKELLDRIITTANHAPTGHNSQGVKFMVVYEPEDVQKYAGMVVDWMRVMIKEQPQMAAEWHWELVVQHWDAGMDRICRGAPHVIVAYGDKSNLMNQASCTIALAYLEIAAQSMGLGTCWAGYFDIGARYWPPMTQALGFPEGHACFGAMMAGYPKFKYHRIPVRKNPEILFK